MLTIICFAGRSLGSGTFGKVRIGTHTITGEKVAIKILEKDRIKDKGDVERVTREINILKKVRHPNVIQLYEVSQVFMHSVWERIEQLAILAWRNNETDFNSLLFIDHRDLTLTLPDHGICQWWGAV